MLIVLILLALVGVKSNATAVGFADVRTYGAAGNGWTNDTAAIQRANDAVARAGGGDVYFPPGTYIASRLFQDSNVAFTGTHDAVIKHPDGTTKDPIIRSRVRYMTGTIAAASNVLTVSSTAGIVPGARISIRGAGGASATQFSKLSSWLGSTGGFFNVADSFGFARGDTYSPNYLLIDREIVSYGSIRMNTMWSVQRGLFGTVRAGHGAGARVSQLKALYARVVSVSGNKVTLDQPARISMYATEVRVGAVGMSIRNLTLDGNRQPGGTNTNPFPVLYELADSASITGNRIVNGDDGAIRFDLGTTRSLIENNVLTNSGYGDIGAAVWLFHGSSNNIVRGNLIDGASVGGIYLDDRTEASTEWDGGAQQNTIENNTIELPQLHHNAGVAVFGSSDNTIRDNVIRGSRFGIWVSPGDQSPVPVETLRNVSTNNALAEHLYGIWVDGDQNSFVQSVFTEVVKAILDEGTNNYFA